MSTSESENPAKSTLIASLQDLGFSQYEARCYAGLLNQEPQTGYSVAKATGVPQPKVYETLRKLVSRGAAFELAGHPVRFLPIPPARLLDQFEATLSERLSHARAAADKLTDDGSAAAEVLLCLNDWGAIAQASVRLVDHAERRLYISASAAQVAHLEGALRAAMDRDVDVVLLSFGAVPFHDDRIRAYRHKSTDGVIYRGHRARHLAVIADSATSLWALAGDGRSWSAIETANPLVIAALKGFIRHDIDMQQVFEDFGPELVQRYGPGLEALERYRQEPPPRAGGDRQVPAAG